MVKIPPWSRDETILALHTYINHGRVRENSPEAQKLSQYLRHLTDPKTTPDPIKFRNPDAVALKLRKFATLDPGESSGMQKGSRMESAVWKEFSSDPHLLSREAKAIISTIDLPNNPDDGNSLDPKVKYIQNVVEAGKGTSLSIRNRLSPIYKSARKHQIKVAVGSAFGLISTAAAVLLIKKKK